MILSRRAFTIGAVSLAFGDRLGAAAITQPPAIYSAALAAIRAYGELHRRYFALPGMTLGVTTPDGFSTVLDFGYANADAERPIGPDTLFQIGSISKLMIAAVLHQFAAEGRLRLTDRISDLLPAIPLPAGNAIEVQHLLDHSAGLPSDAPTFPDGGLWVAYPPAAHWHYSNTGYDILGKLVQHLGGKPLDRLLTEHVFGPLAMPRAKGAIIAADRQLYAQGYEAADQSIPYARGVPLAPAAWVDVTEGAGCVAATADDMTRLLRSLASAVRGRGGLGLSPQLAQSFARHFVPSDTQGMSYGNGLMHVANGNRTYLHHTGGMVSFSSSFHVDKASGAGAFASANLSGLDEYRPRLLTRFAVDALTNSLAGLALPTPPPLDVQLPSAAPYLGRYSGPSGSFEVQPGRPLMLVADGGAAALQPWGGDLFRTTHPSFRQFTLRFERTGGRITGASWGSAAYVRAGVAARYAASDPALAQLAGRFINDSPWIGTATVVERGGELWIGTETPMARIGDNLWRVGEESWSPERASFADFVDGRPQTFVFSGEKFRRHDI